MKYKTFTLSRAKSQSIRLITLQRTQLICLLSTVYSMSSVQRERLIAIGRAIRAMVSVPLFKWCKNAPSSGPTSLTGRNNRCRLWSTLKALDTLIQSLALLPACLSAQCAHRSFICPSAEEKPAQGRSSCAFSRFPPPQRVAPFPVHFPGASAMRRHPLRSA